MSFDARKIAGSLTEAILMERNVANMGDLDAIIANALQHVSALSDTESNKPQIINWIKGNLRNWLITKYGEPDSGVKGVGGRSERILEPGRYRLPDWMYKKAGADVRGYLAANEVFWITVDPELEEKVIHALDFLSTTPPGRDLRGYQVPQVIADAERWGRMQASENEAAEVAAMAAKAKDDPKSDLNGNKLRVVVKFPDGWYWVEFLHATDEEYPNLAREFKRGASVPGTSWKMESGNPLLRRETFYMKHCIGAGMGYGDKLRKQSTRLFSLRNPANVPQVSVEVASGNIINQCYAVSDTKPRQMFWEYIKEFCNKMQFRFSPGAEDGYNFIMTKNGYISAVDMNDFTPEQIAALGIETKKLRKMGFLTVGDTVVSISKLGDLNRAQLNASDATNDELAGNGYVRADDGNVYKWSEMGGKTVKGKTVFNHPRNELDFAENMTFEEVEFEGYDFGIDHSFKVTKNLTIRGGRMSSLPPGIEVGGNIEIVSAGGGRFRPLTDFSCNNLKVAGTVISMIANATIRGTLTQDSGSGVVNIGPGCSIGNIRAGGSNLASVHEGTKITRASTNEVMNLADCPITELMVAELPSGLDARNSKIARLRDGLKVGNTTATPALILNGCPITELPKNLEVRGGISLPSGVKSLPQGLICQSIRMNSDSINYYPRNAMVGRAFRIAIVGSTNSVKVLTDTAPDTPGPGEFKITHGMHIPRTRPITAADVTDGGPVTDHEGNPINPGAGPSPDAPARRPRARRNAQ